MKLRNSVQKLFDLAVEIVFGAILVFLMIGIAVGTLQLTLTIWNLFKTQGITGRYFDTITDVLTLYVLVELSRSLVEYFHSHRLRLTYILDAGIVFVLREILIWLFKRELGPDMLYALSMLLLVLGALRIGSVLLYQREKALFDGIEGDKHK